MLKSLVFLVLYLYMQGCGFYSNDGEVVSDGLTQCSVISEGLQSCTIKRFDCEGELKTYHDIEGDTEVSFIDMVRMEVTSAEDCLAMTITVASLPEQLTINHAPLKPYHNNFSWHGFFDIDNDKKHSKGDLIIGIHQDKLSDQPASSEAIDAIGLASLAEVESVGINGQPQMATRVFFNHSVVKNSFYLLLPKSLHPNLSKISQSTKIQFFSRYNDGLESHTDHYSD